MAKKPNPSPVHAMIRATHDRSSGFGHIHVKVYELFGYESAILAITCQTGGDMPQDKSYAWRHGIEACYTKNQLNTADLKKSYLLMAGMDRRLNKMYDELGSPQCFATYVARVLIAAKVPVVHILESINGCQGVGVERESLPTFNPVKDRVAMTELIAGVERALLAQPSRSF